MWWNWLGWPNYMRCWRDLCGLYDNSNHQFCYLCRPIVHIDSWNSSNDCRGMLCITTSISLKANSKLNDLFKMYNGDRITTKDQFQYWQTEISQLLQRYELGTLPGCPASLLPFVSGNTLTINCGNSGKSMSLSVTITYPSSGTAPYPTILVYGGGSLPAPSRVTMIDFNNDDLAAQVGTSSRGQGKFYTLYRSGHSVGATTAWAWGVSRVIDALEQVTTARIDTTKIGVTRCSLNGKGDLLAGAFNNCIASTHPKNRVLVNQYVGGF
ncbi:carbohydrate-binding module 1 [Trichoderma asperellum]|uniref:carbohydrate-binding module 1 n=2 Tax=Trichoderma asperellum TaxID=101201 RepID=UPI00332272D1|nr:carbohydrate-binding module 1 [Trichoderma asperellum]